MLRFYRGRLGRRVLRTGSDLPDQDGRLSLVAEWEKADIAGDLATIAAPLIVTPHVGQVIPPTASKAFNNIVVGFLSTVDRK